MRAPMGTASSIAVGADGSVWITCKETLRAKGTNLMYYDYQNAKFASEPKAHFMCKEVTVLPNGTPIVLTENGEIFILANLQKILAQSFGG